MAVLQNLFLLAGRALQKGPELGELVTGQVQGIFPSRMFWHATDVRKNSSNASRFGSIASLGGGGGGGGDGGPRDDDDDDDEDENKEGQSWFAGGERR